MATADRAWDLLWDPVKRKKVGAEPTDEDRAMAEASEQWAESLSDEKIDAETSDYLHNLRAVARTGFTSSRTAGIAASAVTAYQREIGARRLSAERAEKALSQKHLGTVGEKVTFGRPPELKRNGLPRKGAPTVLSLSPVTLDFVTGYPTDYGYTTVLKFKTEEGDLVVWKASNTEVSREDVGKKFTLYGTVKEHSDYKGEKQTILTRCWRPSAPA